MNAFFQIVTLLAVMGLLGCQKLTNPSASTTTSIDTGIIGVRVSTQYEGGTTSEEQGTCFISSDAAVGSTDTCTVSIPEGQLYYSKLTIDFSVEPNQCDIVFFQPYYYQASNTAGFGPNWVSSAIDCSASPISADCFSGPATQLVPGFPNYTGLYFLPGSQRFTQSYTADSANTKLRGSNRWTVNDLAAGSRTGSFAVPGDGYLANTMRDWSFNCTDKYLKSLHRITLYIKDKDDTSGNFPGLTKDQADTWSTY